MTIDISFSLSIRSLHLQYFSTLPLVITTFCLQVFLIKGHLLLAIIICCWLLEPWPWPPPTARQLHHGGQQPQHQNQPVQLPDPSENRLVTSANVNRRSKSNPKDLKGLHIAKITYFSISFSFAEVCSRCFAPKKKYSIPPPSNMRFSTKRCQNDKMYFFYI